MVNRKISLHAGLVLFCLACWLMTACTPQVIPFERPNPIPNNENENNADKDPKPILISRIENITENNNENPNESAQGAVLTHTIYFDYERSVLSTDAMVTLKKVGEMLQAKPSCLIDISGHCDERGTIEYNMTLGERRAHSAKKFLVNLGIAEHRISIISMGEEMPVDTRSNEEAWAKNRRADLILVKMAFD